MKKWLRGMYGGRVKGGGQFMTAKEGVDLKIVESGEVGMTPLLTEQVGFSFRNSSILIPEVLLTVVRSQELDYYTSQFLKSGLEGPCNWYRTRKANWEDERSLPAEHRTGIKQPSLFVQATQDFVLSEDLARGMEKVIPNLTWKKVEAGHWALWQAAGDTNKAIKGWIEGVVFGGKSKL